MVGTPPPKQEARVRFSAEPAKGRYGVGERTERERETGGGARMRGEDRRACVSEGGVEREGGSE